MRDSVDPSGYKGQVKDISGMTCVEVEGNITGPFFIRMPLPDRTCGKKPLITNILNLLCQFAITMHSALITYDLIVINK